MKTAYAAEPLAKELLYDQQNPPVWPCAEGHALILQRMHRAQERHHPAGD